jgi:hypothetical protein
MKPWHQVIIGIILGISFGLLITSSVWCKQNKSHICIDRTHRICDGKCSCDGMECPPWTPNNALQLIDGRDYQLDLIEDSILVWDGNRYVGTIPMWDNSPLDSLLLKDNE